MKKLILPLVIFLFAFLLRLFFFTGFILGDDVQEFQAVKHVLNYEPSYDDAFHIRFGAWFFNVIFFKLLGISEFSFFLPTILMSVSMSVIGYYILVYWKYPRNHAFLAGLFIASAPFEILLGVVRANDMIFSWLLALGLFFFLFLEKRPKLQGTILAFFMWVAFYVKLWVVYLFPAIFIYYLTQFVKNKRWRGFALFVLTSLILHTIIGIFWLTKNGMFFPFFKYHSATYPVALRDIVPLFYVYPKLIFEGSQFGTTLFGLIPYALFILLATKLALRFFSKKYWKNFIFDNLDIYLIGFYMSFFLFLNFFPNTFTFDQYYSAPRIFRYLGPISFPMTLHIPKLILDFNKIISKQKPKKRPKKKRKSRKRRKFIFNDQMKKYFIGLVFLFLILANIFQADMATKPGQIYRRNLLLIIDDIKTQSPPQLLSESWLSFFLREVYLSETEIEIRSIFNIYNAKEYESWLKQNQDELPEGTMIITGLGNCVHYGCHGCGFRLNRFNEHLDPRWKLYKEYGILSYMPNPEHARLWIWQPESY